MNDRLVKVKVTAIEQVTPRIKRYELFYGEQEFKFLPGQWIDLYAPIEGKNIGGYTITSSFFDHGHIELCIRESLHHPVTKFMHETLSVGAELFISQGQGKFFIKEEWLNSQMSFTFIAGGIGVTPILSMLRSLKKTENKFKLFYTASYENEILFKDELSAYGFLSATKESGQRISLPLLKEHNVDFNSHFFICGPRAMIDSLSSELQGAGIPRSCIHFEKWW